MNPLVSTMEWRVCARFPTYEVSECGDVRRRLTSEIFQNGRVLKGVIDPDGYIHYTLRTPGGSSSSATAHRLVGEAFLGAPPSPEHQVAHNNGSRLLNTPGNLRWALTGENQRDRNPHGTDPKGVRNGRATITDRDVRYIRSRYFEIKLARGPVVELEKKFGLCRSQITRIARRQAWGHVV